MNIQKINGSIEFLNQVDSIFGILLKPTVLMIRLTANISAGHIIILSFVSLIFIFGANSQAGGLGVGVFSTLFMMRGIKLFFGSSPSNCKSFMLMINTASGPATLPSTFTSSSLIILERRLGPDWA